MRPWRPALLLVLAASLPASFASNGVQQNEASACFQPCECCWDPVKVTDQIDVADCMNLTNVDKMCHVLYQDGFIYGSSLHHAARLNKTSVVRRLLKIGANPDAVDFTRMTPLFHATAGVIELLVQNNATIDAKDIVGRTPLCFAAWKGDMAAVKELVALGASLDAGLPKPLHCAILGVGSETTAAHLVRHGATIGALDVPAVTLIKGAQGAAADGSWSVVGELLGRHEVDFQYVRSFLERSPGSAETVANLALTRRYWSLVSTLVREGFIDCNFVGENEHNRTVFMVALSDVEAETLDAASEVADECLNQTISSGDDREALMHRDVEGYNALMLAIMHYFDEDKTLELIKSFGRVKLLDEKAVNGDCALTLAMSVRNTTLVDSIVDSGAKDLNVIKGRESLLTYLLWHGTEPMVQRALDRGADPDQPLPPDDRTAIFEASNRGEVHMLAHHNASLDHQDIQGRTALMHFAEQEMDVPFETILARGANVSIRDKFGRDAWSYLHSGSKFIKIKPAGYTKMHWAVLSCDAEGMFANFVEALKETKAEDGMTPWALAKQNEERCPAVYKYVDLLQEKEKEVNDIAARIDEAKASRRYFDLLAGIVTVVLTSTTICVLHLFSFHMTLVKDASLFGRLLSFFLYFALSGLLVWWPLDDNAKLIGYLGCGTSLTFFVTMLAFCWNSLSVISKTVRPIKLRTSKFFDRLIWHDVETALKVLTGVLVLAAELRGAETRSIVVISSVLYFSWPVVLRLVEHHRALTAVLEMSVGVALIAWPIYIGRQHRLLSERGLEHDRKVFAIMSTSPLLMGACSLVTGEIRLVRVAANHVEDTCVMQARAEAEAVSRASADDMVVSESAPAERQDRCLQLWRRIAAFSHKCGSFCMTVLDFLLVAKRLRDQQKEMAVKMKQYNEKETFAIAGDAECPIGGVESGTASASFAATFATRLVARAKSLPVGTSMASTRSGRSHGEAARRFVAPPTSRSPCPSEQPVAVELTHIKSTPAAARRSSLRASLGGSGAYALPDHEEEPGLISVAVAANTACAAGDQDEDADADEAPHAASDDVGLVMAEAESTRAPKGGIIAATQGLLRSMTRSMTRFRVERDDEDEELEDAVNVRSRRHTIAPAATEKQQREEHKRSFPKNNRFVVRTLEFGRSQVAARGIKDAIGWEKEPEQGKEVQMMFEEVKKSGDNDHIEIFKYVWKGKDHWREGNEGDEYPKAVMRSFKFKCYHGGTLTEADFDSNIQGLSAEEVQKGDTNKKLKLTEAEIVAVRFYTSSAFPLINDPLRELLKKAAAREPQEACQETRSLARARRKTAFAAGSVDIDWGQEAAEEQKGGHPWKHVVYYLESGIKKLRVVDAGKKSFFTQKTFWRGMKNVFLDVEQLRYCGGVEMAPTSTTKNQRVALAYSKEKASLLFKYKVCGMNRGVNISWLSLYPKEEEYLYPPLTVLHYLRHYQDDNLRIVEVEPQIS